ncbi:LacI family DNA-binding transcriptional regulator [Isoptericola sp. b490]|uniref:LacI family DNA-binding transcriptional regulator n=1 Tax=Actinotalea lenta TaxID=3064654 RepID=UPI0027122755|nr:LacI family DNA-binding transcriptional regulator [Isoptericola sp. b490]MDO8120329.1 LacI family DNA-binding transcriptional regulator [Isoptericola sp. b490]
MADDGDEAAKRPVTIYDVARAAGVAPSTVSRAFARPGRVNADTAARIRQVAAELGYRANPMAQALSTSRTKMIALMISDVTNPFYSELIRGAQLAASEAEYTVLLADARESDVVERLSLERVLPAVEGIVIGSSRMSDSSLRVIAKQKPTIVLNRDVAGLPSVVTDNPRGVRRAVEHLGELGHQQITYVAGPEASWADGARWRALREAGHELQLHTRRVGPVPPTVVGGRGVVEKLLDNLPTAVLAYNDLVAIGLMRGLAAAGIDVPRDVSVIGFDNIMAAELVTPGLTTVAAPLRTMGVTAVKNLQAIINGALHRSEAAFVLPTRLVQRESTARARR